MADAPLRTNALRGDSPIYLTGVLRRQQNGWVVELPESPDGSALDHSSAGAESTADPISSFHLEENRVVRMLLWPESDEPTEIERIAQRQQLDVSIVAQALEAEGALATSNEEFLRRLSLIEQ